MNNRAISSQNQAGEEREALWTAYALDQLPPDERREVEQQVAGDPAAQAFVQEMRRLAGVVEEALVAEETPAPSAALRKHLEKCLDGAEVHAALHTPARRRGVLVAGLLALAGCVLAVLAIPGTRNARVARRMDGPQASQVDTQRGQLEGVATDREESGGEKLYGNLPASNSPAYGEESTALQGEMRFHDSLHDGPSSPEPAPADDVSSTPGPALPRPALNKQNHSPTLPPVVLRINNGQSRHDAATKMDGAVAAATASETARLAAPAEEADVKKFAENEHLAGNEQYDEIVENPFLPADEYALSTFSIDVDTASYANVRRFLTNGQLPPRDAVRIEELINYFTYDDPQPKGNAPFSVNMEVAECPWTPGHHLLRIGLKGKEIARDKRPNSNLVFLLDVSGSMQAHNKLPLVKQAMQMLVRELTENDMVTIAVYAGSEGLALDTTSGDQKDKILQAIENLSAGGSTHASAGIRLAYEKAQQNFLKDGVNRVILCTDGDFNVGVTSDQELVDLITEKAKSNVFLSVLGFGMGNLKDSKMEKLADHGNGNYAYIDTLREARKVLVEQMSGSLVTIAKDVKIQIEFNPAVVASYRQIGYENRVLAARDFDDDAKDAGEIGAGHSVTALYEIVLVGNEKREVSPSTPAVDAIPLKYQRPKSEKQDDAPKTELTEAAQSGELLTVKLRFKEPMGTKSELIEFPLKDKPKRFGEASENLRFASAVAAFGMILRQSEHRGGATMSAVSEIAAAATGSDPNGYRAEFLELITRAQAMVK